MLRVRRGHTVVELVIALTITAGVVALATVAALGQLRFYAGVADVAKLRWQIAEAADIPARVLWGVAPGAGDIVAALDTALEIHATMGSAVTCDAPSGALMVPLPAADGNTLAAFLESPQPDDRAHVYFGDSLGATWLTLRVAVAPVLVPGCFDLGAGQGWLIRLAEDLPVPGGTVVRFTRPMRLSVYRGSDGRWYLGARDWNGVTRQFNGIQPIAGPLRAPSADPAATGFRFLYLDASGEELTSPVEARRITGIAITSGAASDDLVRIPGLRGGGAIHVDSVRRLVALRNVP